MIKLAEKVMVDVSLNVRRRLCQYCTNELLSLVNWTDDDTNESSWNVDDFLQEEIHTFDMLKMLFVFEKCGGTLLKENEYINFAVLLRTIGNIQYTKITTYWYNNEANGVTPVYDVGELEVPRILPKYVATPQINGMWCVEILHNGSYIPLSGEIYLFENLAKDRALELNRNSE